MDTSKKSCSKKSARARFKRNKKSVTRDTVSDKKIQTLAVLTLEEWEIIRSIREYARCHPLARKKAA